MPITSNATSGSIASFIAAAGRPERRYRDPRVLRANRGAYRCAGADSALGHDFYHQQVSASHFQDCAAFSGPAPPTSALDPSTTRWLRQIRQRIVAEAHRAVPSEGGTILFSSRSYLLAIKIHIEREFIHSSDPPSSERHERFDASYSSKVNGLGRRHQILLGSQS